MKTSKTQKYHYYTTHYPWSVLVLTVLVLILDFLFNLWESYHFEPLAGIMSYLTNFAISNTFNHTSSTLTLIGIDYYTQIPILYIQAQDGITGYMKIVSSCTPVKVWLYWFFIILLFPGPCKHKIWYFPIGLIVLYSSNILRICLLAIVLTYIPDRYNYFHSLLETIVYVTLFVIWAIWIEKFAPAFSFHIKAKKIIS